MSSPNNPSGRRFRWQLLLTLAAMGLVMLYLAQLKGTWESRLTLDFETDSAASLHEGMKVNYKGFEIGKLTRLALSPQGVVKGQVQIREAYAAFMTEGAVLKVTKDKIVTAELTLIRDEAQKQPLLEHARIAIQRDDLTADLTKRIDPLLVKFQLLLSQISDPKDGIQANLQQSRQVMVHTVEVLQQSTLAMKAMSDPQSGLPAVLGQTRDTMSALQPTAAQATSTLKELESSLAQTRKTLDTADKLIQNVDGTLQDVQSAPLYRWLVPKKKTDAN